VSAAVQTDSAAVALQSAESAAQNTYNQAYSTAEDAVFSKADEFFSNPYTVNPSFRVNSATYDERQAVARERVALGAMLHEWKNRVTDTPPSADDLDQALVQAGQDLERIKNFLNRIASFVSKQEVNVDLSDTNKAAQEATVPLARTSIDTARSAVSGARTALAGARSSAEVTSISESKLAVGERPEDIAAVEALVTQARGALAGARAQLENSLIRTPIAGTVVTFNVNRGDFVGAQQVVAVVANPRALEVVSYVSPLVGTRLSVGAPVSVGDGGTGIITSVAPGLDPATKKIRVTVSVTDGALVNGSFVSLGFDATSSVSTVSRAAPSTGLMVPISAIKVLPSGLVLLTVNASSTLDAYPIQEGTIIGDAMLIKEGLSPELVVVTDVRGLSPGDRVMIDES
jgi:multidrug efflux pump subunit AcrA (membrane-fusion protein)